MNRDILIWREIYKCEQKNNHSNLIWNITAWTEIFQYKLIFPKIRTNKYSSVKRKISIWAKRHQFEQNSPTVSTEFLTGTEMSKCEQKNRKILIWAEISPCEQKYLNISLITPILVEMLQHLSKTYQHKLNSGQKIPKMS